MLGGDRNRTKGVQLFCELDPLNTSQIICSLFKRRI